MKKIFSLVLLCTAILFSCEKGDLANKTSNPKQSNTPYATNGNLPTAGLTEGAVHNEAMEYVYQNFGKVKVEKTAAMLRIHTLLKEFFLKKYPFTLNEQQLDKVLADLGMTPQYMEAMVSWSDYTAAKNFFANADQSASKVFSTYSKQIYAAVDDATNATDYAVRVTKILLTASTQGDINGYKDLLRVADIAMNSYQYWEQNLEKWKSKYGEFYKVADPRGRGVIKADIAGAVSGAITGTIVGAAGGAGVGGVPGFFAGVLGGAAYSSAAKCFWYACCG